MLSNEAKAITRAVETIKKAMNGEDFDNPVKICGGLVYDNVRDMCNAIIEIAQTLQGGQSHSAHPVGSVYISIADTNPYDIFGFGEWELFAPGKTLVCVDETDADFNAAGKTSGVKTHTLTVAQMPAHTHIQDAHNHNVVTKGWSDGTGGICRSSGVIAEISIRIIGRRSIKIQAADSHIIIYSRISRCICG